jgi:hypothetical protein
MVQEHVDQILARTKVGVALRLDLTRGAGLHRRQLSRILEQFLLLA